MKKIGVGIIGCGTIGSALARELTGKLKSKFLLKAVCDTDTEKVNKIKALVKGSVKSMDQDKLIRSVDLVIEAASGSAAASIVEKCIRFKRDVLIMSVGGLLGKEGLLKKAEAKGVRVYIPSGALCGIDGLKAAKAGAIDSVTLTTRKPPAGLKGAPYLMKNNIDLSAITGEMVVFEGSAKGAVSAFPQNVNVAAVLSLAGIGAARTRVRIVTSPEYTKNIHEVEIRAKSGRITTKTENVPSQDNPKTSALAIYAAVAVLEGIASSVRIGN